MKKRLIIVLLVSLMASVANGAWYWLGTVDNSWANTNNWSDGTVSPPATIPHGTTESMRIPQGTVNADMSDTMGYLMMSRTTTGMPAVGNATVNLNSGRTLNVNTGSTELVSVAYTDGFTNNLNVSSGRLNVWNSATSGEIRLNHEYVGTCVGNLNLSGGIISVSDLNKGDRTGGGNFTGTGGTLVIRDEIDKFGKLSQDPSYGFRLGGSTLEVASGIASTAYVGSIGNIEIGNSQDCDFLMDDNSTIVFDLGLSANNGGVAGTDYDYIGTEGDFYIDGTLVVRISGSPSVNDYWDVFSVEYDVGSYFGYGSFDTLPTDLIVSGDSIQASIVDAGSGYVDTLRLTYIPEPATVILLGLGSLIAVRRRRK